MARSREELHRYFDGKTLRFVPRGQQREAWEAGIDEFGRAAGVTYEVDEESGRMIFTGYACFECGLIFEIGGMPAVLPTCPLCGKDQTERHAVVRPDGWAG